MENQILLEARPYRPFKSSEEYLYAMKEDLAEWFQLLYPSLDINTENFMEKLETGIVLCEHANAVKVKAVEYIEKKRMANKAMSRSVSHVLAQAEKLIYVPDVKFFGTAKPGTFFARDNVSNFIKWCRSSLEIIECLLFESDDLILRKNEKHVILCLLEVARRGARFGMLAPMLVQMERQIDREIAADQRKLGINEGISDGDGHDDDTDSDIGDEETVLCYGPVPQIITNDLKSLDEMVRDLVAKCTCPTQFPMIRVSEGKYRIGDTKVLIFVRILRNHVMVRVGGGWDTLSHYLDKHDPCRCRTQHRGTQGARLVNKPGAADLHGSHVYYERSPVPGFVNSNSSGAVTNSNMLGPPMNSLNRSRSRSPSHLGYDSRRSVSPNFPRKSLVPPQNRSRSPTPNFVSTHTTKLSRSPQHKSNSSSPITGSPKSKHVTSLHIPVDGKMIVKTEANIQVNDTDHSDTTSEMSDEGYRSLGVIQDKTKQRSSLYSQNSVEDADEHDQQCEDDLNDFGLRKTQFSAKIYDNDSKPKKEEFKIDPILKSPKPRKEKSFIKANIASVSDQGPRSLQVSGRERSFVRTSPKPTREDPKSLPPQIRKSPSKNTTWSGRSKTPRQSITPDNFDGFRRNSVGRRSISAGERKSASAATSPTKGKLKQELLQAVKQADDDVTIMQQIQELLKKYGSLSNLSNTDEDEGPTLTRGSERMSFRSPRKDSRPENNMSRIPAPMIPRA